MGCGVGHRRGSDPELLWLWCRLIATTLIRPLAWKPPYATGAALEKAKRQKQTNKQKPPYTQQRIFGEILQLRSKTDIQFEKQTKTGSLIHG